MTTTQYSIKKIRKGGRSWYRPEFTPERKNKAPDFVTEEEARTWADEMIAVIEAGKIQPARKPATDPVAQPRRQSPVFDRQSERVAGFMGVRTPKADGRCHYCGQRLNRYGTCEECQ